jgi:hypothetical protein
VKVPSLIIEHSSGVFEGAFDQVAGAVGASVVGD